MRQLIHALAGAILAISVVGCNSVSTLTPPEDVGASAQQQAATAVTDPQADVNPVIGSQGTTDQQVGFQEANTQPQDNSGAAQSQPGATNTQQNGPRPPMLGTSGGISATQKSIYQASSQSNAGSVRFLPIIGAPLSAVTPLSQALATDARSRGLVIKPSTDTSADHILKGYLSAYQDGPGVTVTYVWDILDNSGARLSRIEGQKKVSGNASAPWANVPPATMKTIAADTIARYLSWKSSLPG
jgi:uncharacterized protein YceK